MNLKEIRKGINMQSVYVAHDRNGNTWIGDGAAYYVLDDWMEASAKNVLGLLDVPRDKWENWNVIEKDVTENELFDIVPEQDEEELTELGRYVSGGYDTVMLATAAGKIIMIRWWYLKPTVCKEGTSLTLSERWDPETGELKEAIVRVYRDMLCCAMIAPVDEAGAGRIRETLKRVTWPGAAYAVGPRDGEERAWV